MEKKVKKSSKKKWFLLFFILVVIAGVTAVIVLPRLQTQTSSMTTSYRTQTLGTATITDTVEATGNVYTQQTVQLSWPTSGIVSKVYVTKGQKVSAGTILAELDQSSLPQSVMNASLDLANAQKTLDDLLNSNTSRANAQLALIQAEQALVDAQKSAQSKLYQRASQETIDLAQASLIQAEDALDKASDWYEHTKSQGTDNVQYANALTQFAAAQTKYYQAQASLEFAQTLPDPLSVEEVNAELDLAKAKYLDAKRAWEAVKDGPNETEVASAEAKIAAAQAVLDQVYIKAPISGTVTGISTQVGDLVSGNSAAFQIDDLSHLYINISVPEVDINSVKIGQPATITLDAIADKIYQGKVTDIASIGSSSNGSVNFAVTVEISDRDTQIKPEMTASATVTVLQLENALVVPISAIREVNSQNVVYVMSNGTLTPVSITVGITSGNTSQVTSGNISAGDSIVLNPPSATTTTTTQSRGLLGGLFGGIFGGGGPSGADMGNMQPPSGSPPSGNLPGGQGGNTSSSGSSSGTK